MYKVLLLSQDFLWQNVVATGVITILIATIIAAITFYCALLRCLIEWTRNYLQAIYSSSLLNYMKQTPPIYTCG